MPHKLASQPAAMDQEGRCGRVKRLKVETHKKELK